MNPNPNDGTITDGRLLVATTGATPVAETGDPLADTFADMLGRAKSGEPVRAADYLGPRGVDAVASDHLLDLVYAEYLARAEAGAPPDVSELVERFPHLADQIRRQLEVHEALESGGGTNSFPVRGAGGADEEPAAIGRYRVVRLLGAGGQGVVYRAVHPELGRDVVIKLARRAAPPATAAALRSEARTLAALEHPGLARVYDLDVHEGRPFAVLEFVDGRPLDVVAVAEPFPPDRAARVVTAAAAAVAHAHGRGLVHRDLKPQNVLIDAVGAPRVIDFGLARLFAGDVPLDAGTISGTVQYMAPEQARGDTGALGPRTDVFGLGGILYYLLTGAPPYEGTSKLELLGRAARGEWGRAKLDASPAPARLKAVCARALEPAPGDRYATADEFGAALRRAAAPRRWPRALALALALVCTAVAAGALAGGNGENSTPTPVPNTPPPATAPRAEQPPPQPKFAARVWAEHAGRYVNAVELLPLATGEKLRYEADAPRDRHLALFAIDATGAVKPLAVTPPRAEAGTIGYPENPNEAAPLVEPAGTVLVILCGRAGSAVTADEVRAAFGAEPWPVLPPNALVLIERDKVEVRGGRGVGVPVKQKDPEREVWRRIDAGRTALGRSCDVLAGVAFSFR